MNNERPNYSQLIKELRNEYNNLKERVCSMNTFILDINFEKQLPHPEERRLMLEKYRSMLDYLNNLRRRIMFYEGQQLKKEPGLARIYRDDKGYLHAALSDGRTIEIDKTNHCGQDASCPVGGGSAAVITGDSLKDLLGMEVISVGDMPCDVCNPDNYAGRPCVKVELVGGTYLCLAHQPNSIIS